MFFYSGCGHFIVGVVITLLYVYTEKNMSNGERQRLGQREREKGNEVYHTIHGYIVVYILYLFRCRHSKLGITTRPCPITLVALRCSRAIRRHIITGHWCILNRSDSN